MVVRLQQLGRIDADQARSLYKQISARGWNASEPVYVGDKWAVWLGKALRRRFPEDEPYRCAAEQAGLDESWFARWTTWDSLPVPEAKVIDLNSRRGRTRRGGSDQPVVPLDRG